MVSPYYNIYKVGTTFMSISIRPIEERICVLSETRQGLLEHSHVTTTWIPIVCEAKRKSSLMRLVVLIQGLKTYILCFFSFSIVIYVLCRETEYQECEWWCYKWSVDADIRWVWDHHISIMKSKLPITLWGKFVDKGFRRDSWEELRTLVLQGKLR